jgi:DNA-binding beta-propeller fold protein YncE
MKSKKVLVAFLSFIMISAYSHAQYVETIVSHTNIIDGLFLLNDTTIYTTPGAFRNITTIGIANPRKNGVYDPNGLAGFMGAINIAQFNDSMLIVPCYDDRTVKLYNQNTGTTSNVATGLDGPAGVAMDLSGKNAYIANYGAPPGLAATTIHKILPGGNDFIFIDTSVFFQPQAIAIDSTGNLYMCNSGGGNMWKIDTATGNFTLFTNIMGARLANIAYRTKDSLFYVSSDDFSHKIYQVDLQGNVTLFAGSTQGGADGPLAQATFLRPLGLAFSKSEDTLYLAEGAGRLRRIVFIPTSPPNGIWESKSDLRNASIRPNPIKRNLVILLKGFMKESFPSYTIYDSKSSIWFRAELNASTGIIDVSSLPKGPYFLKLDAPGFEKVLKFIKG